MTTSKRIGRKGGKSPKMTQWFAIRTAPGQENRVHVGLAERNYPAFLPKETDWKVVRGRKEEVIEPRFPGYIFSLMEAEDAAEIVGLEGVIEVVSCLDDAGANRPFPIPDEAILAIQIAERQGEFDLRIDRTPPPYRPKRGDQVQVIAGPYLTYIGEVLAAPTKNRVRVQLENGLAPMLKVSHVAAA